METYAITGQKRNDTGKAFTRKLRAQGLIPANIYGTGEKNQILSIESKELTKLLAKEWENIIVEISLEGEKIPAIIKDLQQDVVTGKLIHIDFQHIQMGKLIKISVPVHLHGVAPGVKMGGILEHFLRDLSIECLPRNIPSEIPIEISALNVGDSIHVSDLPHDDNIRILDSGHTVIVSVVLPAKAAATTETKEEEGGEEAESAEGTPSKESQK